MADLIQIRRDTLTNWSSSNPKLELGEIGFVTSGSSGQFMTDPIQFKVGNGSDSWNNLPLQIATRMSGSITDNQILVKSGSWMVGVPNFTSASISQSISSSVGPLIISASTLKTSINDVTASVSKLSGSFLNTSSSISTSIANLSASKSNIDGYYASLSVGQADSLAGSVGHVEDAWKPIIRTTAGDIDILSKEPAYVLSVRGATDMSTLSPMMLSGIRFNGFNALDPSWVITGTLSGTTIQSSSNNIAYFRCVKGTWGAYGQSTENNGYLFTDNSGNKVTPIAVKECTTIPAVGSAVASVSTTGSNGYTYYLPATASNYLCAEFSSTVDLSKICAHIAWSNKDDDKFVARSSSLLDLTGITGSIGNGGLYGLTAGATSVADEIIFNDAHTQATWYKRLSKALLSSLTWTSSSASVIESGSTTTTYTYTAAPTNADSGGLFTGSLSGLAYSSSKLTYTSTTVTPSDWSNTISGKYILYSLATSVSGTVNISSSLVCDDMGTEEVLGNNIIPEVGLIRTSYEGGLTDYLRGLRSDIVNDTKVIAQALTEQHEELQNLKSVISSLSVFLNKSMIDGQNIFLEASGSPVTAVGVPVQPWLFYRDIAASPKTVWVSTSNVATSDWIQIG